MKTFIIMSAICLMSSPISAQTLTIEKAVELALRNHPTSLAASAETSRQKTLRRGLDIPKTEVSFMTGQFNSINHDQNITISQSIPFPTALFAQNKLAGKRADEAKLMEQVTRNDLSYRVKQLFNLLIFLQAKNSTLIRQDSLFSEMLRVVSLQYQTGETTLLAKTSAETQRLEVANQLRRNEADIENARTTLGLLCQAQIDQVTGTLETLIPSKENNQPPVQTPSQLLMEQRIEVARQEKKLEVSRMLPDIKISYFNQTLIGTQTIEGQDVFFDSQKRFDGFQFGVSFPLWFFPHTARIKAGAYGEEAAHRLAEANNLEITQQFNYTLMELEKNKKSLSYYRESALKNAELLLSQSQISFKNGEIDYETLLRNMRQVTLIQDGYMNALYEYNNNLITIQHLKGIN